MCSLITIISVIAVVALQSTIANPNRKSTLITAFSDANFAGTQAPINVADRGCTTVPTNLIRQITSISFNSTSRTLNCIFGFSDFNCQGTRFEFTDGTTCLNNLATPPCASDNVISSFKGCELKDFVGRQQPRLPRRL